MSKYFRHSNIFRVALVVLMVAPVLGLAFVPALRPAALMARYLSGQLPSIPDELVVAQLQQIADLGDAGTSVMVEALGSERVVLSSAAGSELHRQLDRWAAQSSAESSPKVARMAELLSSHVAHWDAPARSVAADLASRILRWPMRSQRVRRVEVIAHCEQVLRSFAEVGPTPRSEVPRPAELARGTAVATSHTSIDTLDPRGVLRLPLAGEPGGGLPIQEVEIPPFPPSLADAVVPRPVAGDEPDLMPAIGKQLPYVLFPENEEPVEDPVPAAPASPVPRQLDPELQDSPEATKLSSAAINRLDDELERLPDLDLIRRLSDPRSWMGAAVESQLEKRGFREKELNLARLLASPDPHQRRELAASLDRLTRSPSRWLFWLSYDPDPSVRQQVVSIMATSHDPRLERRLREMLTTEVDTGVRESLRQWDDRTTLRR